MVSDVKQLEVESPEKSTSRKLVKGTTLTESGYVIGNVVEWNFSDLSIWELLHEMSTTLYDVFFQVALNDRPGIHDELLSCFAWSETGSLLNHCDKLYDYDNKIFDKCLQLNYLDPAELFWDGDGDLMDTMKSWLVNDCIYVLYNGTLYSIENKDSIISDIITRWD